MSPNRLSFTPPVWGALLSGLILLWWSPPLGWWKDGGQLVSAAYGLGVAHPSGFPSYLILGKALGFLPLGPIAFRIQLLSVVCAGLTIGLSWAVLKSRITLQSTALQWAIGLPLMFSLLGAHLFVLHGTTPEVYSPTLFALAGLIYAAHGPNRKEDSAFLWMGFWTGLGLGFHFSAMLVSASAVWLVKLSERSREQGTRATLKQTGQATLIVIGAMLAYGYIPLATLHDPWRNWGNPDTLGKLWDHLSASSIRAAFTDEMMGHSFEQVSTFAAMHSDALWESAGLLTIFAPLGGLLSLYRKHPWSDLIKGLMLIVVVDSLFTILINPMGIEDRQTGLHSCWALVMLSALLLLLFLQELTPQPRVLTIGVLTALICSLGHGLTGGSPARAFDRGDTGFPERYRTSMLREAPVNALLLTGGDDNLGLLNQAMGVDGSRPDIALLALPHIYSGDELQHWKRLYGQSVIPEDQLSATLDETTAEGWLNSEMQLQWVRRWVEDQRRPVLWGVGEQLFDRMMAPYLRNNFPLSPVTGASPSITESLSAKELHRILSNWELREKRPLDRVSLQSMAEQARLLGRVALDQGKIQEAEGLLTLCLDYNPSSHRAWTDMSAIRLRTGDHKGAINANRIAVRIRPDLPKPRMRLMEGLFQQGEYEQVTQQLNTLETLNCDVIKLRMARLLAAKAYVALNKQDEAVVILARNLAEDPSHQESLHLLKSIRP